MSRASDLRLRRNIKRRLGSKRSTRLENFFQSMQRRCMAVLESAMTGKVVIDPSAPFAMMLEHPYPPEFMKLRMSDLAGLGASIEISPLNDIRLGSFNAGREFDEARYQEDLLARMRSIPQLLIGKYDYEQRVKVQALPEVDPADLKRALEALEEQTAARIRRSLLPDGDRPAREDRVSNVDSGVEAKPFGNPTGI